MLIFWGRLAVPAYTSPGKSYDWAFVRPTPPTLNKRLHDHSKYLEQDIWLGGTCNRLELKIRVLPKQGPCLGRNAAQSGCWPKLWAWVVTHLSSRALLGPGELSCPIYPSSLGHSSCFWVADLRDLLHSVLLVLNAVLLFSIFCEVGWLNLTDLDWFRDLGIWRELNISMFQVTQAHSPNSSCPHIDPGAVFLLRLLWGASQVLMHLIFVTTPNGRFCSDPRYLGNWGWKPSSSSLLLRY